MQDENDCMLGAMSRGRPKLLSWDAPYSLLITHYALRMHYALRIAHFFQHFQHFPGDRGAPKHIHFTGQVAVILFSGEEVF